jgi:uncharacterized protein (TIGR03086 family)
MTESRAAATSLGDVALLERAISYTLGNLHTVTSAALSRPTPCREWTLSQLLAHVNDSFIALQEAIDLGEVGLSPVAEQADPAAGLVSLLRSRAGRLLGAFTSSGDDMVSVGGCPLATSIVTRAGAVEIAVHGWDVGQACGLPRPIPPELAAELLALAPPLVTDTDRPVRFAPQVTVSPQASPSDRLVAFLGRHPG